MSSKRNTYDRSKSGRVSKPANEGHASHKTQAVGNPPPSDYNTKAVNNPVPGDGGRNSNGSAN